MRARLRIVPIYGAESGRHYLVLDRVGTSLAPDQLGATVGRLQESAPEAIPLVFAQEVYIPQEDGQEEEPPATLEEAPGALTVHVEVPEGASSVDVSSQVLAALRGAGLSLSRI